MEQNTCFNKYGYKVFLRLTVLTQTLSSLLKRSLLMTSLAATLTVATWSVQANPTFVQSTQAKIGAGPTSIAKGDFNGDGKLDVVTTNAKDGTLTVLFNAISSGARVTIGIPSSNPLFIPVAVVTGDIDGDGDLDLIVAQNYTGVYYPGPILTTYKNNGSGTFTNGSRNSNEFSEFATDVAVGDLDGDGDLDAILARGYDGVEIFRNNGTGTFVRIGNVTTGERVTVGDLDGDGDLDLVISDAENSELKIAKNNGNGTFAVTSSLFQSENQGGVITSEIGDVDGDGDLDIVALQGLGDYYYPQPFVEVYKNNGTGDFIFGQSVNLNSSQFGLDIALADFDGDSDLDLVYTDDVGSALIYTNSGTGNLTLGTTLSFGRGFLNAATVTGDFDGDGKPDLAIAGDKINPALADKVSFFRNTTP